MLIMLLQKCNILLLILFFATQSVAGICKKEALPVSIQSDFASIDQITRTATHEGNVVMKQGNHTLLADKLIIQKDDKGALSEITAHGKPATFHGQLVEKTKAPLHASAKVIHFYPAKQLIVLEGEATLTHQQDKFHGPTLSYQIDKQIVSATKRNEERPTIIFHPQV